MYPVPWFSVEIETPDDVDNGTRTEYTVETAIPVIHVYLSNASANHRFKNVVDGD